MSVYFKLQKVLVKLVVKYSSEMWTSDARREECRREM